MTSDKALDRPRIAVLPLFYGRHEVIRGCLDSLVKARAARDFEIFAIENPSKDSPANRRYLREAVARSDISAVYLPDTNAIFNSMFCALTQDIFGLRGRFDYIVLSDGDVEVEGDFMAEQLTLLNDYPKIANIALQIDITKWDPRTKTFAAVIPYASTILLAERHLQRYAAYGGGLWMRMFRADELFAMLDAFEANGIRLRDGQIDKYFHAFGKFAACTMISKGVELPQGPLFIPDDPTKKLAMAGVPKDVNYFHLWNHDIEPDGVVEWPDGPRPPDWRGPKLPVPAWTEEPVSITANPAVTAQVLEACRVGRVMNTVEWGAAPSGTVITLNRQLGRAVVGEGGRYLLAPLSVAEADETTPPFLESLHWDTRDHPASRPSTEHRVFRMAQRLLLPEGVIAIETPDWSRLGRNLARSIDQLEGTVLGGSGDVFVRARSALHAGRAVAGRSATYDLGALVLSGADHGFTLTGVTRTGGRAPSVRYVMARAGEVKPMRRRRPWLSFLRGWGG